MSFPNNIKREHILNALERIDNGDIPKNSDSQYYDLVYKSKSYSPKLVVSFANSYVNGIDLDRNSFDGGPGKPAFKLLEKEGFEIIQKVKVPKIRLYDFHGESALKNAERLLSSNMEWFYWDDGNFKKYIKGDVVFWVNRNTKKAFFTIVDETSVKPVFEDGKNYIRENGVEVYAFAQNADSYENFFRFKLVQIVDIPINWNYADSKVFQNQIMSYILFEHNINEVEKRISKIEDLQLLFKSGEPYDLLNNAKGLLKEEKSDTTNILLPEILEALEDESIKSELAQVDFRFELAQNAYNDFLAFKPSDIVIYNNVLDQFSKFDGGKFIAFLESLPVGSEERNLVTLIGTLVSYCDTNAANKKLFNKYEDKRTLAKAGVRQNAWLRSLILFKMEGNSLLKLPPSIKHALLYLIDPTNGSTMLSERHRMLFCNVFLNGKMFDENTFITDYLQFFEPYGINTRVVNLLNYTEVLDRILYRVQKVRSLWVDSISNVVKSKKQESHLDIFQTFKDDTKSIGLIFTKNQILRYITSLCTKPFVILTGLSGSGKTKLAQSFSKWLCTDNNQYSIVAVGADWTNREPLLGYSNSLLDGQYVTPESGVLDLILRAIENYNTEKIISNQIEDISNCKPYFLILDEMNLSHVERYFADFLSAMESGDDIKLYTGSSRSDNKGNKIPSSFKLPPNFYIVGTVNIDETTYMFSPKVLDRANTIEFRIEEDDLNVFFESGKSINLNDLEKIRQETFESDFMTMSARKRIELEDKIKQIFKSYFNVLKSAGAEFGYRTLNEMAILINFINETYDTKNDIDKIGLNNAIDIAIMQKLLPKLHGSRSKMLKILPTLCELCIDQAAGDAKTILDSYLNDSNSTFSSVKYQLSFNKICRMYKNAIENGFTSYAEA